MPKFFTDDPRTRSNAFNRTDNLNKFVPANTLDEVKDDIKLRKLLQRAVLREQAPQSLVDSIRLRIRE